MSDLLPPCVCCGAEPPPGADWKLVEGEAGKQKVPATFCPDCQARATARESGGPVPELELPASDDITYARGIVGTLSRQYPAIASALDAITGQVALVLAPPQNRGPFERIYRARMSETWTVPATELMRLAAAALKDERLARLAVAIGAVIESSFAEAALAAVTSEDVTAAFGTPRVPVHALRQIEELGGPRASRLSALVGSSSVLPVAGPRIEGRIMTEEQLAHLCGVEDGQRDPRD